MGNAAKNPSVLRIGTRDSALAMVQAHTVAAALESAWPGLCCPIYPMTTTGDKFLSDRLSAIGDKGLFTKELEDALYAEQIDVAIHSFKDLPGQLPPGLLWTSLLPRETPWDVLIDPQRRNLHTLPSGTVVGTASIRRIAQLQLARPDVVVQLVRGNVQTRMAKLNRGDVDVLLLAGAGLHRLNMRGLISQTLLPEDGFVPAPGQGILAAEYAAPWVKRMMAPLVHAPTQWAAEAEWGIVRALEGGCSVPLGAHSWLTDASGCVLDERAVMIPEDAQAHVWVTRFVEGKRRPLILRRQGLVTEDLGVADMLALWG